MSETTEEVKVDTPEDVDACTEKIPQEVTENDSADKNAEVDANIAVSKGEETDPYAYVANNGFTSEKYKIEIRGLPKYYGIGELRSLLNDKLNLECNKIKAPFKRSLLSPLVYACFRSEEARDKALSVLHRFRWKGKRMAVKVADPAPDPLVKRRLEEAEDDTKPKKFKLSTMEELHEALANRTAPLWKLSHEEQIKKKTEEARGVLRKLGVELVKQNPSVKSWLEKQQELNDGLPCKLLDTKYVADHFDGYRNKCEFTIAKDELTGERRVGMRLGAYAHGLLGVGPVDKVPIMPQIMKDTANTFEKYIKESKYDIFNPEDLSGFWKQLTVRYSFGSGELMVIVGFHPQSLSNEELASLKEELKNFFQTNDFFKDKITSLYFQLMKRREKGNDWPAFELLLGNKYIEETLCGLKFKIGPESFFQVNSKCAELLMSSVRELAHLNKETVLLDVCCGAGTIGLCLAKDCAKVLGIEIVPEAVGAAKENTEKNAITNAEFFCGKADEIFTSVFSRVSAEQEAVAVLDPPRAGLQSKAISMLRKAENLKRLVFLSCDSKNASKNFVELGRAKSKTLAGNPFLPHSAVVVDMFPHTDHFELVLYFERVDLDEFTLNH